MKRELVASIVAVSLWAVGCCADEAPKPEAPAADPAKVQAAAAEAAKSAEPTGAPKIEFDKMVYDFGKTSLVQQLAGTFVISNAGNALLELKKPSTTCGCTLAALKTDKLEPGEKTDLSFTVNVGNARHVEKGINVPSNDPKTPTARLTLKADIIPVYDYNPQNVMFNDIRISTTNTLSVDVKRTDGKPLGIGRVESTTPAIHAKIEPKEGSETEGKIIVEAVAENATRPFAGMLNIYAPEGKQSLFTIPFSGRFVGDVALTRPALFWGITDPANWPGNLGQSVTTQKIGVSTSLPDLKLEVINPTCTLPDVKVSINPAADGKSVEIDATVDKAPAETQHGVIKFETNVKSQPTIEIPVTITVMKRG